MNHMDINVSCQAATTRDTLISILLSLHPGTVSISYESGETYEAN
jgi:hypothetical protein